MLVWSSSGIESFEFDVECCRIESDSEVFEEARHAQQCSNGKHVREPSTRGNRSPRSVYRNIVKIDFSLPLNAIRDHQLSAFDVEADCPPDTRVENALRCTRINDRVESF